MPRIWPRLVSRGHLSAKLAGEVALVVALGITLAFTWSDGVSTQSDTPFMQGSGNSLFSGDPFLVARPNVVTPDLPAPTAPPSQLLIPSLDVHRAVEAVGTNRSGVMNLPVNSWNAGWYSGGPVPGAPGDAVIEGHAGYPGQPMIFCRLVTLRPGARIVVVLSDGSRQLFLVDSMTSIPVGAAPAGLAEPYGPPRLTLITCTGHFDKNSYSYSSRLVVEASYAGVI
jgi:Sortase domain